MSSRVTHWEKMYLLPPERIPWEIEEPPRELKEFLKTHRLPRGARALDIACGTGNYSVYLAKREFDVTGVDFSRNALVIARRRARTEGLKIRFLEADALALKKHLKNRFDFILDYSLLHHITDKNIATYAKQFRTLLAPRGLLLVVCYSEKDSQGEHTRKGAYGNRMYYRTKTEILKHYQDLVLVSYHSGRLGKRLQHRAHSFLFKKV